MKIMIATAAALSLGALAQADEIEVLPGQWIYEVTALLGFVPLTEGGNECVSERGAKRSLSRTAASLGDGCSIASTDPIDGGYRFVMRCNGNLAGEVDGEITTTGENATLSASGWVSQEGVEVPVSVQGKAERTSATCL